ncbi:hypothetical protein EUX98_g1429 [Antrodiella citrinella]|uniref:HNH nuclease domain-containing protein n=1 Tax=Antrodiella citrinella TaxID=2447956 RepID=A0A4S4N1F1_9APHY|nr:hypothetical protein EUX98_g1429 [Antrodiella citrinella]
MPDNLIQNLELTINRTYNVIMLSPEVHQLFDIYDICLKKISIVHEYKIEYFNNEAIKRALRKSFDEGRLVDTPVTLNYHDPTSTAGMDDLPNPLFIELHATIARIFRMSGAGKFFENLLSQYPPTGNSILASTWADMERQIKLHDLSSQIKAGLDLNTRKSRNATT